MDDLISRQAAIDALDKRFDDVPMELTTEILQLRHDLRERIPSAQPATNCSEIPNSSDDTISRQAAIDCVTYDVEHTIECLKALPSAQPETCEGCKHLGKWENEVEYGYPSPCTRCKRRVGDHYER